MNQPTIHLIANAHLDPVWLWDWREGLNEGLITVGTILDLMDEYPEMTFVRGEAAIYQHIERTDPAMFDRIRRMVEAGRWDVVGGAYVQMDTNLPATETFARHFARGQSYFRSRFGRTVRVAWAADSFGHSAGLPEILAAAGIQGYAFSRPGPDQLRIEQPAFWWEGPGGSRVLAYRVPVGWYGAERSEMIAKLDGSLALLQTGALRNVGCFYGLGNHGGGPTRRQLDEIRAWSAAHPGVRVLHSGLHALFDALAEEVREHGDAFIPTHRGELNFCLRGCYASVARFKYAYRRAEAALARAERTDTAIGARLGRAPADLGAAWDALLFNSFHDILPGSSIERAYDDQIAWLGSATHAAQEAELSALNALAARVDTSVPPVEGDRPSAVALLVWNPHPHPYRGRVALEAALDYRPIWAYTNHADELPVEVRGPDGAPVPFQVVATEHDAMPQFAWRKRVAVPVEVPALGWSVYTMAYQENPELAPQPPDSLPPPAPNAIANAFYSVRAEIGAPGVRIDRAGVPLFGAGALGAITVEDPWGSWGGMAEEPDSLDLSTVRCTWAVTQAQTLDVGPELARLWVRLEGGSSRLDLTFSLYRGEEKVEVAARLFWNERAARLKLVFPVGDQAEFEVPGGAVKRGPLGEVPGGRWVRVLGGGFPFGFASDALYAFDCKDGALRATVARAGGYATDVKRGPQDDPWRATVDAGELRFRFLLAPGDERLPILARELEEPPVALLVPARSGDWPRTGSLASLSPSSLRILALKPAEDGDQWILRVQETAGCDAAPDFAWMGEALALGAIPANRIATWRLARTGAGWSAVAIGIAEA
jgi:alpha-mannosidase